MILLARTAVHPQTTLKVVWLSGASDPFSSTLSDAEERFLESFTLPRDQVVWSNFPFTGPCKRRHVPLPMAALSNVLQFLVASTPVYRWFAGRHWRALCASASSVLVVAGSCGAQLLRALERATPDGVAVHALALGPVAWRAPRCLDAALVGTDDGYSRVFARSLPTELVEAVPGVDHMSYLESDDVVRRVRDWILARRDAYTPTGGAP
jgi:hypothetical protein